MAGLESLFSIQGYGCEELYVVKKQFEYSNLTKHLVEFAEFDTLA